jgi:hypothetical protein
MLLGYGAAMSQHAGVGLRAGVTFENHLYLGGTFVYHAGYDQRMVIAGPPGFADESYGWHVNDFYGGAEVGYEVVTGRLLWRPYAGVGPLGTHMTELPIWWTVAFWPGLEVAMPAGRLRFAVDARVMTTTVGGLSEAVFWGVGTSI